MSLHDTLVYLVACCLLRSDHHVCMHASMYTPGTCMSRLDSVVWPRRAGSTGMGLTRMHKARVESLLGRQGERERLPSAPWYLPYLPTYLPTWTDIRSLEYFSPRPLPSSFLIV
ncbi:hypothetical protein K504DRAFT_110356 [Pleomassaria siparia CBS 279.74]|uniref:Uncharacterized protein n=1 Tax=Pleomassaria siparia CBS 279.74 TaxID=1314801 RepID=A0A6G1JVT1_9PLEO|nr:hypothetical protein K504DRAFT_110356 [Pleomassaria siparia CBS 279.74]